MGTIINNGKIYSAGFDVSLPIKGILHAGESEIVLNDGHISDTSVVRPLVDEKYFGSICPYRILTENGKCTLYFNETFSEDIEVGIILANGEEYYDRNTRMVNEINSNLTQLESIMSAFAPTTMEIINSEVTSTTYTYVTDRDCWVEAYGATNATTYAVLNISYTNLQIFCDKEFANGISNRAMAVKLFCKKGQSVTISKEGAISGFSVRIAY